MMLYILLMLLGLGCIQETHSRSFVIDYENNCFSKDGHCFQFISGSLHYFRVPQIYWKDRLSKMVAAGLNAVQTYVDWSQHEPYPGKYNFDDILDIVKFIKTADSLGLLVIVRAGPYIDAERDMGGLPFWLMQEKPDVALRTADEYYMKCVDAFYGKLLQMIKPYLYANGGPVISVQVENEYGSDPNCDFNYMVHLRDLFRKFLGDNVVLFTTDGNADSLLRCGKTQGLYATIDFGPGVDVAAAFKTQRNHEPRGPSVNSEYYPGWLDHWAYPHAAPDPTATVKTLFEVLSANASLNMYMFHGGTNFGFTNGANLQGSYQSIPTSYDYNAPLSEAGDTTAKYFAIRDAIAKYTGKPLPPVPKNVPKYKYGAVQMKPVGSLLDLLPYVRNGNPIQSLYPLTFEQLGQAYGFVLYETFVHNLVMDPAALVVKNVADRGYVFIDNQLVGIVSRQDSLFTLPVTIVSGQKLSILVENQGRVCYGSGIRDFKGLVTNVTLGDILLKNWNITQLPFNNTSTMKHFVKKFETRNPYARVMPVGNGGYIGPALFTGQFTVPNKADFPLDTYIKMDGWYKGVIFVNGFNVGRYWPIVGPQITLYLPKNVLKPYPQENSIVVFELEKSPCSPPSGHGNSVDDSCIVDLVDTPILDGPTPHDTTFLIGKDYKFRH